MVRAIGEDRLSDYTHEEDFSLGAVLGYGRRQHDGEAYYLRLTKRES